MTNIRSKAKTIIIDYINCYYSDYNAIPSVRDISVSTVHRCLRDMKENGELEYRGRRSISTLRIDMEQNHHTMPVLGYVSCGEGQEETEEVIEYIRMPESLVGKGEFFALIAKANPW